MASGWHRPVGLMPFFAHLWAEARRRSPSRALPNVGDRVFKLQLPHRALDRDDRARRTDRRAPAIDADPAFARLVENALRRACHLSRALAGLVAGRAAGELVSARVRWTPARCWPVA